jgi:hypothetical protein
MVAPRLAGSRNYRIESPLPTFDMATRGSYGASDEVRRQRKPSLTSDFVGRSVGRSVVDYFAYFVSTWCHLWTTSGIFAPVVPTADAPTISWLRTGRP